MQVVGLFCSQLLTLRKLASLNDNYWQIGHLTFRLLKALGIEANFIPMNNPTKADVLTVKSLLRSERYEECRSVSVWSFINHRHKSCMCVRNPVCFIFKFCSIDTLSTSPISCHNITTLHHEARYNPVECSCLVKQILTFLSCAECPEVLHCFG